MKTIILILMLLNSTIVMAGNLSAPLGLPSAATLPKGVRNINYKGLVSGPSSKYNNAGSSVGLGDSLNTDLTFQNIINGTKSYIDKGTMKYAMEQIEATPEDSLGQTEGVVNVEANVHVPIFAWGVTENWTAAVAVPIMKTSVNVDTAFSSPQDQALYNKLLSELEKASPGKFRELQEKLADPIGFKLNELGYDPLVDEQETKLGDIKIVNKYKFFEDVRNRSVAGVALTLPTGRKERVNKAADLPGGDGQTDLGFSLNHDFMLNGRWTLSTGLEYTWQMRDSDYISKRIPFTPTSKLSDDIDSRVIRELGDIASASFSAKYKREGATLAAAYTVSHKGRDQYTGHGFSQERYEFLEADTEQAMQALTGVVSYDTISLYRQKKFPAPLLMSVTHSRVLSGKNVVNDPITVFDLSLFF